MPNLRGHVKLMRIEWRRDPAGQKRLAGHLAGQDDFHTVDALVRDVVGDVCEHGRRVCFAHDGANPRRHHHRNGR
jgi:hypothetical protein